jgi:hypothetical protein
MKRILLGSVLAILGAGGCTYHSSIAMGPTPDKVFVTKTTSYIIWSVNKMELCSWSGTAAANCVEVTEQ